MIDRFALIVGAMKSGTTSLFAYLAQHPAVAPSTPKELNFFTREQDAGKDLDWYLGRWDWDPCEHRIALEASTSYTKIPAFPNAAERIARVQADFRFIYLMRDPIDRIESMRAHHTLLGGWAEPDMPVRDVPQHWIAVSKYAMQIGEYYKRFPSDRILLLDFVDLTERPTEVVERVCRFLAIDPSIRFKGLATAYNVSKRDHPFYLALSQNRLARAAARFVPTRVKQSVRNRLAQGPDDPIRLSEAQREFAQRELAEDIKRLRDEYGFDTSRWTYAP